MNNAVCQYAVGLQQQGPQSISNIACLCRGVVGVEQLLPGLIKCHL